MKRRILFVDDEPNILQALQRMLRSMDQEWDMEFAPSGQQAFSRLGESHFDVIVSDVRMPGMDGVTLLRKVREHSPHMVRLLLSGQADKNKSIHSVGVAHQFLAKPCDAETLKTCVRRCCHLTDLIFNDRVKAFISQIECLPVLPSLYNKLVTELEKADPSLERIGKFIESDIGMSAKILNIVNSAFFGLPRTLTSASQATAYLGLDTIKDLVLVLKLFEHFEKNSLSIINIGLLWQHSLSVADLAKRIMKCEGASDSEANEAFTAGMLHDVGVLILASQDSTQFQHIIDREEINLIPIYDLEKEIYEISHAELGAYLLEIWGLPVRLIEAVGFHHQPSQSSIREFHPILAVHVAHGLTASCFRGPNQRPSAIDEDFIRSLGLEDRLSLWKELNAVATE